MEIIIKNYKDLIKNKYYKKTKSFEEFEFSIEKNYSPSSLEDVIQKLNENKLLNPSFTTQKLEIVLENFSNLNSIKFWFKNKIDYFNSEAEYNFSDKKIYVNKNIFNKSEKNVKTFTEYLYNKINNEDYLNIIVLHEIGHSIHHQYFLNYKKHLSTNSLMSEYLNKTVNFFGFTILPVNGGFFNQNKYNTDRALYKSISEGFSDLYSAIAINRIYDENKAKELINHIKDARIYADNNNEEYYQTNKSLNFFINDLLEKKNDVVKMTNIYDYMSSIIEFNTIDLLKELMNNNDSLQNSFNNLYVGVVSKKLNIKTNKINESIDILNEKYILNLPHIKENEIMYKLGYKNSIKLDSSFKKIEKIKSLKP